MAHLEPIAADDPMRWTLGDRIYKAMRYAGLNHKELSELYKDRGRIVSRQLVAKWTRDESEPSATDLVILSEITGVEREWLLAFRCNTDFVDLERSVREFLTGDHGRTLAAV